MLGRNAPSRLVFFILILVGLAAALPCQAQYREYYFYGKVLDTQKNPIPGVEIVLRDVVTSRSYSIKTNKSGEFRLAGLPHGTYSVTFKKEGYATKEDEWKFETPQDTMQKVEIPPVFLATQAQVREAEQMKEMQGVIKEAFEKIQQRDYDGAIALLKDVLGKNPKDSNALYLMGVSYSRKLMCPEAIDALLQAIPLVPKFAPAYFELATCYHKQNDLDKALENYQKTLELDPGNPDAAYNSGLILFSLNRIDEALSYFEKALAIKPGDPEYLEMAGRCYIHQAEYQKAIDYLEKAKAGAADEEKKKFLDDLITKLREQIKK
jgi:Tfp pilus assembly protein PilF